MISATSTSLNKIWDHAKNVRADFIQHSNYEDPSDSEINFGSYLFGGGDYYYYYYDNDNTSESTTTTTTTTTTTEAPNDNIDPYGKYTFNSDSKHFIDQENIEKNYRNMYRLLNSNNNNTNDIKNINSVSEKMIKNGALLFVFLNSNPQQNTYWRKYWLGIFYIIVGEEPFKSVLMTNEVIKNSSPIEKIIVTNFFAKLASLVGFQYNLPINFSLGDTHFEHSFEHVQGAFYILNNT